MPTASGILCATYTPQEEPDTVNSTDFSTELFCQVDDAIADATRHSQAILSVSEVATIGILYVTLSKASASALAIPGARTTTAAGSPNCRNAPAGFAAGIRSNTGRDASGPRLP